MTATPNLSALFPVEQQFVYRAIQQGKAAFSLSHKQLTHQILEWMRPSPKTPSGSWKIDASTLKQLQERREQLIDRDWQDAEAGIYPVQVLFDDPWDDFVRYYPLYCAELPEIWNRRLDRRFHEFSPEVDRDRFPRYYLQNFHGQIDGYLSDRSANLYDLQVEVLFNGMADPMRRRTIAPLVEALQQSQSPGTSPLPSSDRHSQATEQKKPPRILDLACGTGRMLRFLRAAIPNAHLFGLDLSPHYLRKANQSLSALPGELPQLVWGRAEDMPYRDRYFDGIVSVFLFHELPASIRRKTLEECYRVLKPGGTLILCDSLQQGDVPQFDDMLASFPTTFHEPYYHHYLGDDLNPYLKSLGFQIEGSQIHFFSKYWIAQKQA